MLEGNRDYRSNASLRPNVFKELHALLNALLMAQMAKTYPTMITGSISNCLQKGARISHFWKKDGSCWTLEFPEFLGWNQGSWKGVTYGR